MGRTLRKAPRRAGLHQDRARASGWYSVASNASTGRLRPFFSFASQPRGAATARGVRPKCFRCAAVSRGPMDHRRGLFAWRVFYSSRGGIRARNDTTVSFRVSRPVTSEPPSVRERDLLQFGFEIRERGWHRELKRRSHGVGSKPDFHGSLSTPGRKVDLELFALPERAADFHRSWAALPQLQGNTSPIVNAARLNRLSRRRAAAHVIEKRKRVLGRISESLRSWYSGP